MSFSLTAAALRRNLPTVQRFVLVALADHAQDDGSQCFPSVSTVSALTGYDRRTVQRALRQLVQLRVLTLVSLGGGGRKAAQYHIHLEVIPDLRAASLGRRVSQPLRSTDAPRGGPVTRGGRPPDAPRGGPVTPDPIMNPIMESIINPTAGARGVPDQDRAPAKTEVPRPGLEPRLNRKRSLLAKPPAPSPEDALAEIERRRRQAAEIVRSGKLPGSTP